MPKPKAMPTKPFITKGPRLYVELVPASPRSVQYTHTVIIVGNIAAHSIIAACSIAGKGQSRELAQKHGLRPIDVEPRAVDPSINNQRVRCRQRVVVQGSVVSISTTGQYFGI